MPREQAAPELWEECGACRAVSGPPPPRGPSQGAWPSLTSAEPAGRRGGRRRRAPGGRPGRAALGGHPATVAATCHPHRPRRVGARSLPWPPPDGCAGLPALLGFVRGDGRRGRPGPSFRPALPPREVPHPEASCGLDGVGRPRRREQEGGRRAAEAMDRASYRMPRWAEGGHSAGTQLAKWLVLKCQHRTKAQSAFATDCVTTKGLQSIGGSSACGQESGPISPEELGTTVGFPRGCQLRRRAELTGESTRT